MQRFFVVPPATTLSNVGANGIRRTNPLLTDGPLIFTIPDTDDLMNPVADKTGERYKPKIFRWKIHARLSLMD